MTTCLEKSCSFGLPQVPFVNCCQFICLVISLLVLRAGCGIWLYRFLVTAYLFTQYTPITTSCIINNFQVGWVSCFDTRKQKTLFLSLWYIPDRFRTITCFYGPRSCCNCSLCIPEAVSEADSTEAVSEGLVSTPESQVAKAELQNDSVEISFAEDLNPIANVSVKTSRLQRFL